MHSLTTRAFALLTFVSSVLSAPLGDDVSALQKRQNTTLKAPIVAKESQFWEGLDGEWSTFALRVGTPPQVVRVMPATSLSEVWVVSSLRACNETLGLGYENCEEDRGGVFRTSRSSTWELKGSFELGLNKALGYSPYENGEGDIGQFGYDKVGFGLDPSSGPQYENVIVSEIFSTTWWGGLLGLSPEPLNYSEFGDPKPSFTTLLKDEISSVAYSYTAGAKYKGKGIFGQLIYGGYDASRFEENDAIFTMTGDSLRDIVVTLRGIKSTVGGADTQLLSAPQFVYIDSSIPEMVLPLAACEEFEKAFGIKHDEASGRYLMDEATHNSLKEKNPSITFTLANSKESERMVDIVLPYAAFDLQIQSPLLKSTGENSTLNVRNTDLFTRQTSSSNSTPYFPLRRAPEDNPDLFTLGRAFLQEAYLTVDYNSRTFNLSQALFPDPLNPRIIAIPSNLLKPGPNNEKPSEGAPKEGDGANKGGGLSTGALAGIIVAAVLGGLLLVTLVFFCCPCGFCPALTLCGVAGGAARRRKRKVHELDASEKNKEEVTAYGAQVGEARRAHAGEPGGIQEVSGNDAKVEIGGNPIMHPQEMEADLPPGLVTAAAARQSHELDAGRPSAELEAGNNSSNPNISSESRTLAGERSGGYLSSGSGSGGISSVSGESPATHSAWVAEVHGTGIRPLNGPADRLGRVEEVVSPVSPSTAQGGWPLAGGGRARPDLARINTDERNVPRVGNEPTTGVSPQTPASRRWGQGGSTTGTGSDSEGIYGDRR